MSYKTRKLIMLLAIALFVVALLLFPDFFTNNPIGIAIDVVFIVAYTVFTFIFWRCKHCKRTLNKTSMFSKYCPFCGKELE